MKHPVCGAVVAIFGIEDSSFGCSCEHHSICGRFVTIDTLIRLKRTTVAVGTSMIRSLNVFPSLLILVFNFADANEYRSILGAYWVTEGVDRCLVGRVADALREHFSHLDGRLVQVLDIYSNSNHFKRRDFARAHGGVCHAILVDEFLEGDQLLNSLLVVVDSDSDSE